MARQNKPLLPPDLDLDAARAAPGAAERPAFLHEQTPGTAISVGVTSGGVKERAAATTLYLLPDDHLRLRTMALRRNVSFQTLMLDAIDFLLEREGEPPVGRWETRRKVR